MEPPLTLQREVRDLCATAHYPHGWPRHRHCPCCGSTGLRDAFVKWEITHQVCGRCRFVFMNPYPNDEFLTQLYNASFIKSVRTFIEMPKARAGRVDALNAMRPECYDEIMDFIARYHTSGRWLDVGGGIGHFLHRVRQRFPQFETYLNELSEASANFAKDFYHHQLLTQLLPEIAASGMRFDVITMVAVLEHIPHPKPVLQQLIDLLNPGGILLVNVPHFSRLNRKLSHGDCGAVTAPYHVNQFNWHSLPLMFNTEPNVEVLHQWDSGPQAFYCVHLARIINNYETLIPTTEREQYESIQVQPLSERQQKRLNWLSKWDAKPWLRKLLLRYDGRVYLNCAVRKRQKGETR